MTSLCPRWKKRDRFNHRGTQSSVPPAQVAGGFVCGDTPILARQLPFSNLSKNISSIHVPRMLPLIARGVNPCSSAVTLFLCSLIPPTPPPSSHCIPIWRGFVPSGVPALLGHIRIVTTFGISSVSIPRSSASICGNKTLLSFARSASSAVKRFCSRLTAES